ncbi:hypothetical protein ABIF99_009524 [Bradyrhizobium japonicum]
MKSKSSLIILGSVFTTVLFSDHAFAQCQGSACGDLVVQERNGCIILVNRNPNRAIKVTSIAVPSTIYDVYANSEKRPTVYGGSGACHTSWYQRYSADYM